MREIKTVRVCGVEEHQNGDAEGRGASEEPQDAVVFH